MPRFTRRRKLAGRAGHVPHDRPQVCALAITGDGHTQALVGRRDGGQRPQRGRHFRPGQGPARCGGDTARHNAPGVEDDPFRAGPNCSDAGAIRTNHDDFEQASDGFTDADGNGVDEVAQPIPGGGRVERFPLTEAKAKTLRQGG